MSNRLAGEPQSVPAAARREPGGLVSLGRGGFRACAPREQARSSCRSATRPATGATSWSTSRSSMPASPGCSTSTSCRSRWTGRSGRTSTGSTWRSCRRRPGAGGWPMSVWLTPDLKPFFGGTYFPPESRWGRAGFPDVLREVSARWTSNQGELLQSADAVLERLRGMQSPSASGVAGDPTSGVAVAGLDALSAGVQQFASSFDARHGGFGGAPKFPRPVRAALPAPGVGRARATPTRDGSRSPLSRRWPAAACAITSAAASTATRSTPRGACRTSRRCSTDQAQLVLAFLEAGQAAGAGALLQVAEDTIEYVRRDMTSPEGAFYSAEDADSLPPEATGTDAAKSEGAFYPVDRQRGRRASRGPTRRW